MAEATGIVRINERTIELPEAEARTLFLAAVAMSRRGGPLAITPDIMVAVNQATQISITIADGFTDEYDPEVVLTRGTSKSTRVMRPI